MCKPYKKGSFDQIQRPIMKNEESQYGTLVKYICLFRNCDAKWQYLVAQACAHLAQTTSSRLGISAKIEILENAGAGRLESRMVAS
jgi:hypothetical protein